MQIFSRTGKLVFVSVPTKESEKSDALNNLKKELAAANYNAIPCNNQDGQTFQLEIEIFWSGYEHEAHLRSLFGGRGFIVNYFPNNDKIVIE